MDKQGTQRDGLMRLLEPFPKEQISKLPRKIRSGGGERVIELDYVGHARVTRRLLEVDPAWRWAPLARDDAGLPRIEQVGGQLVLWIELTVLGVARIGVGTCSATANDPLKELIGDAIRNAAMRFGVALDLWMREEERGGGRNKRGEEQMPEVVRRIARLAGEAFPDDREARDEWFRRRLELWGASRLRECTPEQLDELAADLGQLAAQQSHERAS